MGFGRKIKDFDKKIEDEVRDVASDVRESPVGEKVKSVAQDIAESVNYFFTSDKAKKIYTDIEHKIRELKDDFVESLKKSPKEDQEKATKFFDEGMDGLKEDLKDSKSEEDFNSKSSSFFDKINEFNNKLNENNPEVGEDSNSAPVDLEGNVPLAGVDSADAAGS